MNQPKIRKEIVTRLIRILSILSCLSPTRKVGIDDLLEKVPEIQGIAYGRRTLQRDLTMLCEHLPIQHDGSSPRGYRLPNTAEGHALQELSYKVAEYFRQVDPVYQYPRPEVSVRFEVHKAQYRSYVVEPLTWTKCSEGNSSILWAISEKESLEKKAKKDYSGPTFKFKIVKITEETLS